MTTFLVHKFSNDVATEQEWLDIHNSMDIEDWFGKEAEEITDADKVAWQARGHLVKIDMAQLLEDVSNKSGLTVFNDIDSDYDRVAVVGNESYGTYLELANAHGLDLDDYRCPPE